MGRVFPVVVSVLLPVATGCAQLVGIDETRNTGRTNTAELTRVSIGATVSIAPTDLTGLAATYLVDEGGKLNRVAADRGAAAGTWTAHLPDPTPIELTAAEDAFPHLFAFPTMQLELADKQLEHPDPVPARSDATIALSVPLDVASTATDLFAALAVGAWTERDFSVQEVPAGTASIALTYPYSTSKRLGSSSTTLDAITTDDAFVVLRYADAGSTLTGVAEPPAFNQTGADTVTTGPMVPVTADQTLEVKVDQAALASRFAMVRPLVSSPSAQWRVVAAPGYRYAIPVGPQLMAGSLVMDDVGVSAVFGNPFVERGWRSLFELEASGTRTFTPLGGMAQITLHAALRQFIEPGTQSTVLDLAAGLPTLISLDGVPLSADGQSIAAPHDVARVSFTSDTGNATRSNLEIFDFIAATADTGPEVHQVYGAQSREQTFEIPPEIFEVGHTYVIRAGCVFGGFPNIESGDLATQELPVSFSTVDSAVFTVTP